MKIKFTNGNAKKIEVLPGVEVHYQPAKCRHEKNKIAFARVRTKVIFCEREELLKVINKILATVDGIERTHEIVVKQYSEITKELEKEAATNAYPGDTIVEEDRAIMW